MEVFRFISTDKNIEIKAATVANQSNLWTRFISRVGIDSAYRYCDYASSISGILKLNVEYRENDDSNEEKKNWIGLPPVFYETATYNFTIRFKGIETAPQVVHKLKEVTELFTLVDVDAEKGDYILTVPLNFLNEPGVFNLSFRYKPKDSVERTDTISFRVVSPKLDTKDDYLHILNEINRTYNEIVYQYLTKTVQNLGRGGHSDNDIIWLSIFRQVIDNYIKAVNYIVNCPHLRESKEVLYSKVERIKRWTPKMAQRYVLSEQRGTLERDYFRHEITINTNDTPENRFVKFSLERIRRRLNSVFNRISKNSKEITPEEVKSIINYRDKLRKLSNSPLFRGLKAQPLHNESMVLQKRTGYSQVYRYWIMLQKGIELYEGSTQIGVRPIWELYELWCFLKIRQMVAKIAGLSFANAKEITEDPMPMIEPFTENNQEHTVYYHGKHEVRLHYQHTYNRNSGDVHTATTNNRPDIVLTIKKADEFELTYLFDAKYRVSDDNEFTKENQDEINRYKAADYPPSDAINQMHRYRDAIYYGKKIAEKREHSAKEIIGGYILFPGRGDDQVVKNQYFYKSIETVNIGAFPLLPNHLDPDCEGTLLYEHLVKIITEQDAYEQIQDSIPQHGLVYSRSVTESNDLVLVGYYKEEQKDPILNNKLYYVPAAMEKGSINLVSGYENTKYLLLHHGDDKMLLELSGKGPRFFTADILRGMGFNPSREFYLGFDIKSTTPIKDINISRYKLPTGKYGASPYFTRFKDIEYDKI